jgi:hypothetical protein
VYSIQIWIDIKRGFYDEKVIFNQNVYLI